MSAKADLTFTAGTIQSHMLAAQLHPPYSQEVKGIDARCVSNLIWALVKLDLALEAGCTGNEVIISISPLVLRLLNQSSPQVKTLSTSSC